MKKQIKQTVNFFFNIAKTLLPYFVLLLLASGVLYAIMGLFYLVRFLLFNTKIF